MTNLKTIGFALLLLSVGSACDTKVTNPGAVKDEDLVGEQARGGMTAMVAGAGRAVGSAMNWIGYTGAAVAREIHPAGSTGSFGITNRWQNGELNADDADLNVHWEQAQRARWVAEEAVRRLEAMGPPPAGATQTLLQYNNLLQLAYVDAGFANRLLGENMCDAVIDGGPLNAGATIYLQRAESLFTKAINVTGGTPATMTTQRQAAYGGRAAVRVHLGNWVGAISDAGQVPIGFAYNMPYYSLGDDAQRNRIFWSSGNSRESGSAYRAHTQWNTWHILYKYGTNSPTSSTASVTADPRVTIAVTALLGDAAIDCCGRVPFFPEAKHAASAAAVRLTSGREMQLILAEERLRANDDVTAMGFINAARTNAGAPTITTWAGLADAWRLLKRERGIELWLESRRLGDLRRWAAGSTPGTLDALEMVGAASHLQRQDLCFPVSRSERDANPNF